MGIIKESFRYFIVKFCLFPQKFCALFSSIKYNRLYFIFYFLFQCHFARILSFSAQSTFTNCAFLSRCANLTTPSPLRIITMEGDTAMKFSLWNFRDWYEAYKIDLSYTITENIPSISMLATASDAADSRLGCALVLSADQLADCSGFRTALQFERDRILFPIASPSEVLNLGNAMIEHYTQWENTLLDQILSDISIDAFLNACQSDFPFPLALLHLNGVVLCHTADWSLPLSAQVRDTVLKNAMQRQQPMQPFFSSFYQEKAYSFLTNLIYANGRPFGILITYEEKHKLQPGDILLFHTLSELMQTAIQFRNDRPISLHPLATWYFSFVNDREDEQHTPVVPLSDVQWQSTDYYQVAAIEPVAGQILSSDLLSQLTDMDHCCVQTSNGISMLIHFGSNFPKRMEHDLDRLRTYCPETDFRIGLSLPFRHLSRLSAFCQQSQIAVKIAQKKEAFLLPISDSLSVCILHACRSLPCIHSLIDPVILQIAEADQTEGEHLLETLYTYLIFGQSVSQTSDALFIHRNTLRHRLNKVKKYLPNNWTEPKQSEQLLLSIMLYQNEKNI